MPDIKNRGFDSRIGSSLRWLVPALLAVAATTEPATGELVRLEITERRPFADGESFGDVGPYERIAGKAFFAIDPDLPQNRAIVDLQYAPRNDQGRVEFSADLFILAPKRLNQGNRALLYDVNNRGNKLALRFFNDAPGGNNPSLAGNGFLMRQGFTVVWSGWIGELLPGNARLRLSAPVARNAGKPITGRVRYEIVADRDAQRLDVSGANHGAYRPTDNGFESATLTWRLRPGDRRAPIPRDQFLLHVTDVDSDDPSQLPRVELEVKAGFRTGYLYELIYEAQDPLVHGVTFAGLRDLVAALKHGEGNVNPLCVEGEPVIERAYGFGVSQSGRFLREFLHAGFNEDEQGRAAFDGLMPHVAGGGLGSFNHRFAQPTAFVTQRQHHDWPTDRFPFAYESQKNPLTGEQDGILARATRSDTAPKIMHTQSSTEYWSRSGSLVHTDPQGTSDADLPGNVRIYAFGGTQHGPGSYPPKPGAGQTPANPADYRPLLRSLLVALDRWCAGEMAPPPSVYPRIDENTLVDWRQSSSRFPAIPAVRYPDVIQQPPLLDLGKRWQTEGIIDRHPPVIKSTGYTVRVPRCGPDGNELGCLLVPSVGVPLATFTGWNLRNREAGAENDLVGLNGSYILLPLTERDRAASGDPRPSLEGRYQTLEKYEARLKAYCRELVDGRYLLPEDVEPIVERQRERAEPLFEKIGREMK